MVDEVGEGALLIAGEGIVDTPDNEQVTVRAATVSTFIASGTSIQATIPSSTRRGDLIVALVMRRSAVTNPTDYTTVVDQQTDGFDQWTRVIVKEADLTDAGSTLTVTQSASGRMGLAIIILKGDNGQILVETSGSQANNISPSIVSGGIRRLGLAATSFAFSISGTSTTSVDNSWDIITGAVLTTNRLTGAVLDVDSGNTPTATWTNSSPGSAFGSVTVLFYQTMENYYQGGLIIDGEGTESTPNATVVETGEGALIIDGEGKASTLGIIEIGEGALIIDGEGIQRTTVAVQKNHILDEFVKAQHRIFNGWIETKSHGSSYGSLDVIAKQVQDRYAIDALAFVVNDHSTFYSVQVGAQISSWYESNQNIANQHSILYESNLVIGNQHESLYTSNPIVTKQHDLLYTSNPVVANQHLAHYQSTLIVSKQHESYYEFTRPVSASKSTFYSLNHSIAKQHNSVYFDIIPVPKQHATSYDLLEEVTVAKQKSFNYTLMRDVVYAYESTVTVELKE